METVGLLGCMLFSFGIGFVPVINLSKYKDYRRKRNRRYLKKLNRKKLMFYDNSPKELS